MYGGGTSSPSPGVVLLPQQPTFTTVLGPGRPLGCREAAQDGASGSPSGPRGVGPGPLPTRGGIQPGLGMLVEVTDAHAGD